MRFPFHYSFTNGFTPCVDGWWGPSILRERDTYIVVCLDTYIVVCLEYISAAAALFPFLPHTIPMFVQESATERADESLGVQFEWLDVTGMYPKYDRRVQISSLYSEEQRVCICFLLCSQSLWLFRERVVSTEHFPANAGGFCEHLPCLTLLCHLLKD